jgi:glutathione peroxidase
MSLSPRVVSAATALIVLAAVAGCEKHDHSKHATPEAAATEKEAPMPDAADTVYSFSAATIDAKPVSLSRYQGKVLLIVNVASQCGNTPQYGGLEDLYEQKKAQGLVILGFPANDFGRQEPGTNEEILAFCTENYGVTFPMFAKITVKGEGLDPLYAWLTDEQIHPDTGGEIGWNFTKFLVGRDGKVIARFEPKTQPSDPALVKAVEAALQKD